MNIISIESRRLSTWVFLLICAAALAFGLLFGLTNAQSTNQHPSFEFADGEKAFCADGSRLNVGSVTLEANPKSDHKTPEAAIKAYIEEVHQAGSVRLSLRDSSVSERLYELLEPARQFSVSESERQDINENLIYFNKYSSHNEFLEVRIVVEKIGETYFVTQTFVCETQLVSDPALHEQLWSGQVNQPTNNLEIEEEAKSNAEK